MKNKIIFPVMFSLWSIGLIMIAQSMILIEDALKSFLFYRLMSILLIGSGIIYIGLLNIIHKIASPIEQLTKDAKLFSKGNYTHQLRNYEVEEIQLLANAFDNMGEELNGTIRKLIHQKTKMESILKSLDEGIIVIDKEGQMTDTNALASQMLGLKEGKYYRNHITNIIRGEKFKRLIDEALNRNQYGGIEFEQAGKIIYVTIVPVEDSNNVYEYLIVFKDITQLKNLQEMKYQFVSNVSHEIKTPLTSIQGFVETLKEGAIEDPNVALRFLNIIDIEAKRLYRLIQDILILSEFENMEKQNYGIAKVNTIIERVVEMVKEEANKKNIDIIMESIDDIVLENTNSDHIEQVMINLISNAIKYTDNGCVVIQTEIKDNQNIITIRDTGIGIPSESIPRIFERFYRVDKSRSRKSGGTGLGLSIVKHIMQLYGAQIKVQSMEGKGTTFTLIF